MTGGILDGQVPGGATPGGQGGGICPACGQSTQFVFLKRRRRHVCVECEAEFETLPSRGPEPQTIFLSYAHRSERDEDFDVSEDLVLLIKAALERDGHRVWIDKEGIRSGAQWRERITHAILGHAHFLSFLSRRSVRNPGVCLNEIAIALGSARHIQTLLTDDEQRVSPPLTISHIQWHDFQGWRNILEGRSTGPQGERWDAWFNQRMDALRRVLADAQGAWVMGDLQRLRDILLPLTFEARIIEKTDGFFGRQWLFDEAQRWLDGSQARLFWLKAGPGIGKSAFAARLVHQSSSAVIGFFMCDFQGRKDPAQSAREAICTLAFQMASRLPDYRLKLLHQQRIDRDKVLTLGVDELFETLITEPLNASGKIPESRRLSLVIDGLDEAGRNDGSNALAELLNKHASRLPPWLGVIVTSRPEPYLEHMLAGFQAVTFDAGSALNQRDLADYVEQMLPETLRGDGRARAARALLDRCGGTFLYLRLVAADPSIDVTRPETLPDKLDGFFAQSFRRYFPEAGDYGTRTEPFLRLMAAAPGPLPAALGRQILGWGTRDLRVGVVEPLGSLVQARSEGFAFFHASLSDWLRDPGRSGRYTVEEDGARTLGEFLWTEFERIEQSTWPDLIEQWLAALLPSTSHWDQPDALESAASFLHKRLRYHDVVAIRRRCVALLDAADRPDPAALSAALIKLAKSLKDLSSLAEAQTLQQRALELRESSLGPADPATAEAVNALGVTLKQRGDYEQAEALYRRALAVRESALGADHPDVARSLNNLAILLKTLGRLDEAEALYRRSLAIVEATLGPDHQLAGMALNNLAIVLKQTGRMQDAEALYRRSIAQSERGLGTDHPRTALRLSNLGELLVACGRLDEAQPLYDRALSICERALGEHHLSTAEVLTGIGGLLQARGHLPQAQQALQRATAVRQALLGTSHAETATSMAALADVMSARGDTVQSLALWRQVLEIRQAAIGPDHPDTIRAREAIDALRSAGSAA